METSSHVFGTKRSCGICLCMCILSDVIILAIYWNRLGEAICNPIIAIIRSLKESNSSAIQDSDEPAVGRMIYHFLGSLLYIAYTFINIIVLTNTIVQLYYLKRSISWNPSKYRFLRPFIFAESQLSKCYFITVMALLLLICMDDVLISHTVGYKLPFNELSLEVVRQLTMLAYQAMGHVINTLFFGTQKSYKKTQKVQTNASHKKTIATKNVEDML